MNRPASRLLVLAFPFLLSVACLCRADTSETKGLASPAARTLCSQSIELPRRARDQANKAKDLIEETLELRRKVLGPDHPKTKETAAELAKLEAAIETTD